MSGRDQEKLDRSELPRAALDLLEENALSALRSPTSRGAVPVDVLATRASRARGTVRSAIEKELGADRTGFDLAVRYVSTLNEFGGNWSIDPIVSSAEERQAHGVDPADIVRAGFQERFERSRVTPGALAAFIVQCSACANVARAKERGIEPESEASNLVRLRTDFYHRTTELFEHVLDMGLREIGRRPRSGYSVCQIVTVLNSCYDGMLLRGILTPEEMPSGVAAEVLWQLALSTTEPGLLLPPGDRTPLELKAVRQAIPNLSESARVDWNALVSRDVPMEAVKELFSSPSNAVDRSMDLLVGTPDVIDEIRRLLVTESRKVIEDLLNNISRARRSHPELVSLVSPEGAFVQEVSSIVEAYLRLHEGSVERMTNAPNVVTSRALSVVLDALQGRDREWFFQIDEFFSQ